MITFSVTKQNGTLCSCCCTKDAPAATVTSNNTALLDTGRLLYADTATVRRYLCGIEDREAASAPFQL